jgi:methylmalonyl-CoA mutase
VPAADAHAALRALRGRGMSTFPDFAALPFDGAAPARRRPGPTPGTAEGIAVRSAYGPTTSTASRPWAASRVWRRSCAAPTRRCTPPTRGPSASTRASPRRGLQRLLPRNLAAGQMGLSIAFDLATHRATTVDHRG